MISIALKLHTNKYHATPWGRHVNEGIPEWPPSPWRLLRALVSSWKRTMPEVSAERVGSLLAKLSAQPTYWLPPATFGHTRHYMPLYTEGKTTLVFDTFVVVNEHEPRFIWLNHELNAEEHSLLQDLCHGVTYLGRAESWCTLRVETDGLRPNCQPISKCTNDVQGESVSVLCPSETMDADELLDVLMVDTEDLRSKQRRVDPPGSTWVDYVRPEESLMRVRPVRRTMPEASRSIVAVRYALDRKPLPRIEETVTVGEAARRACMSLYGYMNDGDASEMLSGRHCVTGKPLTGHRHAFYLPADEDGDGRIDTLTVYAPGGFNDRDWRALATLRKISWYGKGDDIRILLLGALGEEGLRRGDNWLAGSQMLQSRTPVVLTRYPKVHRDGTPKLNQYGTWIDGPEDQMRREWQERREHDPSLPALVGVDSVPRLNLPGGTSVRWLSFRTQRQHGRGRSSGFVHGLKLEFEAPVRIPVALGYGCHFGLGQFAPASN